MKTKYSISEKYLGFCFSDKTTPAIENYVPVIYGLQNKIQDTFLKIYRAVGIVTFSKDGTLRKS